MGARPGLWLAGSTFGAGLRGADDKRYVQATAGAFEHAMTDPAGMFVIVAHQGYEFHAIDGCDLAAEDPAVWLISEGETMRAAWPSVNEWFRYWSPDIAEHRERLELMREIRPGGPLPGWARDIESP